MDDRGLMARLRDGVVLGAEGSLFELERRGYLKSGPYVPEVVLDRPEAVAELHGEFLRAGAEVMVAFTYYGHEEKLRAVGRAGDVAFTRHRGKAARCRPRRRRRGAHPPGAAAGPRGGRRGRRARRREHLQH